MKNFRYFIFGIALMVMAVLAELAWIRTGDMAMAIYTLLAALSAAALIEHGVRRIYDSAENARRHVNAAA